MATENIDFEKFKPVMLAALRSLQLSCERKNMFGDSYGSFQVIFRMFFSWAYQIARNRPSFGQSALAKTAYFRFDELFQLVGSDDGAMLFTL